jgi:hypothetical protein
VHRIVGNSTERVSIADLHDVIYYKQIKEYTDQEFESSRDLKRELSKGRVALLDSVPTIRSSSIEKSQGSSAISLADLKAAIREILPEMPGNNNVRGAVMDLAPMIADVVRQEISKVSVSGSVQRSSGVAPSTPVFQGPEYVPTINTDGLKSNVEAKTQVSEGVDDTLLLLRQLNMQRGTNV